MQAIDTEISVANGKAGVGDPIAFRGENGRIENYSWTDDRITVALLMDDGDAYVADPAEVWLRHDAARAEATDEAVPVEQIAQEGDEDVYPVPNDMSFGAFDVKEAGDLRQIAEGLIGATEDFPWLRGARIAYYWQRKGGSSDGVPQLAGTRKSNKIEQMELRADMVVWVAADTARDLRVTADILEAIVHERLCAIDKDEHGGIRRKGFDFRGYTRNVQRFGPILPAVKAAAAALGREPQDVRNVRMFAEEEARG